MLTDNKTILQFIEYTSLFSSTKYYMLLDISVCHRANIQKAFLLLNPHIHYTSRYK